MTSQPASSPAAAGGRRPLVRSFAFRLGAAFALVAIAGAAITALMVNAAFASQFGSYLRHQQHAQISVITAAASRAYAGGGKWDRRALDAIIPTVGSGYLRILTPTGAQVWQWNGHTISWNNRWMAGTGKTSKKAATHHGTGHAGSGNGGNGSRSGSGSGGWDQWDHWNGNGSRNWGSGNWGAPAPGASAPAARLVAYTASLAGTPSPSSGQLQRAVIKVNGKVVGTALIALPPPAALPEPAALRSELVGLVLAAGAGGALISLILGLVFARRAARPIRDMTTAARAVAAGEHAPRVPASRDDEFGDMERAFNALADAAEDEEKLRQGFAAEVAHELRTPLTILRSQVEGLRAGVLNPTPDALASLDEEVRRMSRLVADLQVLGSADAAGFSLQRTSTDLGQLADETAREFAALFEGSEITLETALEPVTAWVDRTRVSQILANLLSNTLKYTPAGGLVRLRVTSDGPWAVLQVTDNGPGIPADELPHVFDRFFRGRTTQSPGTGTGLTVVSELATAHGGTAEAVSDPGHGAAFTIRLPRQTTQAHNRSRADQPHPSLA